jgi:hypothetical protein
MEEPLLTPAVNIKTQFLNLKPDYAKNNKEYLLIVKELKDMGFDLEMIDMVFCFFEVRNVEQACQYMTQENGVWQHTYIESENKLCIICGNHSDHLNYKVKIKEKDDISLDLRIKLESIRNSSNFNLSLNNSNSNIFVKSSPEFENRESVISVEGNFLCKVCEIETNKSEAYTLKCKHYFCNDCWFYYMSQKISYSEVDEIFCMMKNCRERLSEGDIRHILKPDLTLLDKYNQFKLNKVVIRNENMKFCPTLNCKSYIEKTNDTIFLKCGDGHKVCYNCLKGWHDKKKCEDVIDADFEEWKKGKLIKKCPSCKFWTEKNEGCNHMTCRACNFEWCWICIKKHTSNHYTTLGGCLGLQYGKSFL